VRAAAPDWQTIFASTPEIARQFPSELATSKAMKPSSNRPMIAVRGVTKTYGSGAATVSALRNVDLTIHEGEFVSIMGPSGSGKSTLLNLVSAIDTPTSGSITIDGHDIAGMDDDALTVFRRRKLGLVFQFFNLLPTLDALENVLLPVALERGLNAQDRARALELLREVGLETRANHGLHELSGGQMQRVAIARALILDPRVILADEPTGNLDSATGDAVLALLRRLCDTHGVTIVMVTHDRRAAAQGDRVIWLKDGRVVDDAHGRSDHGFAFKADPAQA
jgi:putative ABC transport system ATP-binding protein